MLHRHILSWLPISYNLWNNASCNDIQQKHAFVYTHVQHFNSEWMLEQCSLQTSILAFLRGLCLLRQAGVQPCSCLCIVTVRHKGPVSVSATYSHKWPLNCLICNNRNELLCVYTFIYINLYWCTFSSFLSFQVIHFTSSYHLLRLMVLSC